MVKQNPASFSLLFTNTKDANIIYDIYLKEKSVHLYWHMKNLFHASGIKVEPLTICPWYLYKLLKGPGKGTNGHLTV